MYQTLMNEVASAPDICFQTDRQVVEIGRFNARRKDFARCFRYHTVVAFIAPEQARVQAALMDEPKTMFHDVRGALFVPAGTKLLGRHYPNGGSHRVLMMSLPDSIQFSEDKLEYARQQLASGIGMRSAHIQQYLLQVAHEATMPGHDSKVLLQSLSGVIGVHIARALRQERLRGGLSPWQLRKIQERLDLSEDRHIPTLDELAKLVGISPRHLRRAFKESTGLSIGQQIDANRLKMASTLLCETVQPIKEIAWRLGFADQYSFTVAFKRRTGQTPSAFRRHMQSGEAITEH